MADPGTGGSSMSTGPTTNHPSATLTTTPFSAEAEDLVGDVERQLSEKPDDRSLEVRLAELLLSRDPARAEELAAEAVRSATGPTVARAHCTLGMARYRRGMYERAVEALS